MASGMTNFTKVSVIGGYYIGASDSETQIINSSGAFIGAVAPSSVQLANGSAAAPSLSFANSPTTGAFRKAANSLGFSAAGVEAGSYTSAGVWTIGATSGTSYHTINGPLFVTTAAGASLATLIFDVRQTRASASSHCAFGIRVSGTTGGDPFNYYQIPSGSSWSAGVDNSDSDSFKISQSFAFASNDFLTISTAGLVTIGTGTSTVHRLNTSVATGATAGADTLPANPVGFIAININGTARKIPYYAT